MKPVETFYAWSIDISEPDNPGLIGRFWWFGIAPLIPTQFLGCKIALFETREQARKNLKHVRVAYPLAKVIKVRVLVEQAV